MFTFFFILIYIYVCKLYLFIMNIYTFYTYVMILSHFQMFIHFTTCICLK